MRLGLLAIPAVRSAISLELGRDVEFHWRIASTQVRARELAARGARPAVVVADEQTAGEGTKGRSWSAPKGTSLLASWLFRPAPAVPALFALLSGVAVARALDDLGVSGAFLKWPNDVEVGHKKIAGVLAHATTDQEGGFLVLGIGLNAHQTLADIGPDLRATATSLALEGHDVDRLALLARITRELDRVSDVRERAPALDEWRRRATVLGRQIEVTRDGLPALRGMAREVADDGSLLVGSERIVTGTVRVLE